MNTTTNNATDMGAAVETLLQSLEKEHGPLVGVKDAAAICGRSKRTLEAWRAAGNGPTFLRVVGRLYYPVAALREYLVERKVEVVPATRA